MRFARYIISSILALTLWSCSTTKNTLVTRTFHNTTARFNGYYYSCEAIKDGVFKIEKANKDNYEKILPIYIYPSQEKAKSTFPDFDKAIKKSSLCIQRHAIKDGKGGELASAGKWIDNNWINIGISHFYKREFFSAIEAFEYVIRTYNKSEDKYTAMLWLIKANNEIGSVSSSEPIISLLKNAKGLPLNVKNEFPVVQADYYMRRGQNTEAYSKLMETVRNNDIFSGISRKRRSRYAFIIAQMLEQAKDNRRAVEYYKKTIQLKPSYEMVFYSKIKIARLMDLKPGNSDKIKKDLMKMTKEFKNSDYYDVIFYTLGEIEEREKNIPQAINFYKRSVQTSTVNPNQKALSYLKLAEINFELTNYVPAEAYYDSAVVTLPKDHPDYKNIEARKKTLETLVKNLKTISTEDSLQRIAKMSESDRNLFIEKLMENMKREDEKRQRELEAAKNSASSAGNSASTPGNNSLPGFGDAVASFPFYNPNTVALGVAEFTKKWGNRKLEDNWRRSNKAITIDDPSGGGKETGTDNQKKYTGLSLNKEMFLKNLPLNDTLILASTNKIIKAYYVIGSIYKEELNNNKKTISTFEELNTRFPNNQYALNTYYSLYRIYLAEKNQTKADFYKNKILSDFPDSEFALLIKDPGYAQERSGQVSELEKFYAETFELYHNTLYPEALTKAKEGIASYGKSKYIAQFEFIKAMSAAHVRGTDSLEHDLKLIVAKYPTADITPLSNDILLSIKKQKNPELFAEKSNKNPVDTFNLDFEAMHFVVAVTPDKSNTVQAFIGNLGNFNGVYYSDKKFEINSNLFSSGKQLVVIKSFDNAKTAVNYFENLKNDPDVFKGEFKKEDIQILPILASNLPFLYKKKNFEGYKLFFDDNYKKLNTKN